MTKSTKASAAAFGFALYSSDVNWARYNDSIVTQTITARFANQVGSDCILHRHVTVHVAETRLLNSTTSTLLSPIMFIVILAVRSLNYTSFFRHLMTFSPLKNCFSQIILNDLLIANRATTMLNVQHLILCRLIHLTEIAVLRTLKINVHTPYQQWYEIK